MKVKIFVEKTLEKSSFKELENEINKWLSTNDSKVEILSMHPAPFPGCFAIVVVYSDNQ